MILLIYGPDQRTREIVARGLASKLSAFYLDQTTPELQELVNLNASIHPAALTRRFGYVATLVEQTGSDLVADLPCLSNEEKRSFAPGAVRVWVANSSTETSNDWEDPRSEDFDFKVNASGSIDEAVGFVAAKLLAR